MDARQSEKMRRRIRQIIAERSQQGKADGGFLPIPLLLGAASALPSIIDAGKKLFSGSGKHKPEAKTRKPNHHAMKVKKIMKENPGMSLAEASRMAAQMK
jgi:hypothetical protein